MSILFSSNSYSPLNKQNVYKYSAQKQQQPIFCTQSYVLFQKSFRKLRQIYLTNKTLYIVSNKKLKLKIPLISITKLYVGILSGQIFIVSTLKNIILDCAQGRKKIVELIQSLSPQSTLEYINYTLTDFLIQRHSKLQSKQKMTVYDSNQKKIQLKYYTGEKLNFKEMRIKWEMNKGKQLNQAEQMIQKSKIFKLKSIIVKNKYWNIFKAIKGAQNNQDNNYYSEGIKKGKQNKQEIKNDKDSEKNYSLYTIKLYSKKFIGQQQDLLEYIWNQRKKLQELNIVYIPTLYKAFYTKSNIFLICDYYNGFLLNEFSFIKNSKLANLISQIVVAIGQLHQAGLVYRDIQKSGIMINEKGYILLYNLGKTKQKGTQQEQIQLRMKTPQNLKGQNKMVDFSRDWYNLGQLIFEIMQKEGFYQNMSQEQIQDYLTSSDDNFPRQINNLKWQRDQNLINLAQCLLKKNPKQRLGSTNDYHQILHHLFFQDWLKMYSKSQIMNRTCKPIFKKVNMLNINHTKQKYKEDQLQKQYIQKDNWDQMDSYLKGYEFTKEFY